MTNGESISDPSGGRKVRLFIMTSTRESPPTTVIDTERLAMRRLTEDDAPFILRLVNEPSFLRHIGDKGVRTLGAARHYIRTGPIDSYDRFGFGLLLVVRKDDAAPIGMCGLLKRDSLEDVDIGFAYLPEFWRKGYAIEAATAVMNYGLRALGLPRIVAVTNPENAGSIRVLEKIGLTFGRMVQLGPEEPEIRLYEPA